jgi:hypothetical protein
VSGVPGRPTVLATISLIVDVLCVALLLYWSGETPDDHLARPLSFVPLFLLQLVVGLAGTFRAAKTSNWRLVLFFGAHVVLYVAIAVLAN